MARQRIFLVHHLMIQFFNDYQRNLQIETSNDPNAEEEEQKQSDHVKDLISNNLDYLDKLLSVTCRAVMEETTGYFL
jgi:hypothetical protein